MVPQDFHFPKVHNLLDQVVLDYLYSEFTDGRFRGGSLPYPSHKSPTNRVVLMAVVWEPCGRLHTYKLPSERTRKGRQGSFHTLRIQVLME